MPNTTELLEEIIDVNNYKLYCVECNSKIVKGCSESVLLNNELIRMFSTNKIPKNISGVYKAYKSSRCDCIIKDNACNSCGNIVGYSVIQPCIDCLACKNNGNLTMFFYDSVTNKLIKSNHKKNEIRKKKKELTIKLTLDR